jgi:hypothetical protein
MLAGIALLTWCIQRARGRRWIRPIELVVLLGLLFAVGVVLNELLPLILS